jgi:ankyrin repeat protein
MLRAGLKPHWCWICETMRGGHLRLAEMVLESGVARNVFTMAAMSDAAGLARRLGRVPSDARHRASMEPASQKVTPLHVACASDWWSYGQSRMAAQLDVAKILVERGGDLNAVARYRGLVGSTPLFCACWSSRNLALVRWLLDQGALAADGCLWAALGHFQRHGKEAYDIAEALLAWGLPVNGGTPGGLTPLHTFAHQGAHRTVAWLIAHGADVNARGPGNRTAAHLVAERNTGTTTLALLVGSGANLAARDDDGNTPLEAAKRSGKARIAAWISSGVRGKGR